MPVAGRGAAERARAGLYASMRERIDEELLMEAAILGTIQRYAAENGA